MKIAVKENYLGGQILYTNLAHFKKVPHSHKCLVQTFCDAYSQANFRLNRVQNGICGESWRDVDNGGIGACFFDRIFYGIKHRYS